MGSLTQSSTVCLGNLKKIIWKKYLILQVIKEKNIMYGMFFIYLLCMV